MTSASFEAAIDILTTEIQRTIIENLSALGLDIEPRMFDEMDVDFDEVAREALVWVGGADIKTH